MSFSKQTENYGLGLYENSDFFTPNPDMNDNMQKIDTQMKVNADAAAALDERVTEEESAMSGITERVGTLETKITSQENTTSQHTNQITAMQSDIAENKVDIQNLQSDLQETNDTVNLLTGGGNYSELKERVSYVETAVTFLNEEIQNSEIKGDFSSGEGEYSIENNSIILTIHMVDKEGVYIISGYIIHDIANATVQNITAQIAIDDNSIGTPLAVSARFVDVGIESRYVVSVSGIFVNNSTSNVTKEFKIRVNYPTTRYPVLEAKAKHAMLNISY